MKIFKVPSRSYVVWMYFVYILLQKNRYLNRKVSAVCFGTNCSVLEVALWRWCFDWLLTLSVTICLGVLFISYLRLLSRLLWPLLTYASFASSNMTTCDNILASPVPQVEGNNIPQVSGNNTTTTSFFSDSFP